MSISGGMVSGAQPNSMGGITAGMGQMNLGAQQGMMQQPMGRQSNLPISKLC